MFLHDVEFLGISQRLTLRQANFLVGVISRTWFPVKSISVPRRADIYYVLSLPSRLRAYEFAFSSCTATVILSFLRLSFVIFYLRVSLLLFIYEHYAVFRSAMITMMRIPTRVDSLA